MTEFAEPVARLFGERLRELRTNRGESTRSLARTAAMSYTYVSNLENGLKVPTLATVVRLAAALGCKVRDLVEPLDAHDLATLIRPRKQPAAPSNRRLK